MKECNFSLRKPNKRNAFKKEDRIVRLQDYLKNIWMVRKYFLDTYAIDSPINNGDHMPLHRNESASQKTLPLKSETVFVKENYMPSRERVTCSTHLCSNAKVACCHNLVSKVKVLEHIWYELSMVTGKIVSHRANVRSDKGISYSREGIFNICSG